MPFEIPDSWVWTRLSSIFHFINGDRGKNYPAKAKLKSTGEIPFISAVNMENGTVKSEGLLYLTNEQYNLLGGGHLNRNDFVFCLRGSLGKFCQYPFPFGAIASSLVILRKYFSINDGYIKIYLAAPLLLEQINDSNNGTAQPNLGARDVSQFLFPLPPLAEQARIVTEIEKFEPLIAEYDKLEQQATKLDEQIYDKLKKSILQYAIQGKLVPQNPNDEPASVLLERIRAEKKAKLGKKYVNSYIYKGDDNCYYEHIAGRTQDELVEVPFDIPYGWSWCRLANFAQVLGGKRIPAGRQLTNENTGHYYIKVSDMKENTICLDKLQFVPIDIYPTISRYIINKKDVYITVAGTIGRVGTIPNELDGANLTENADRIVLDEIDQLWLVKCLLSDVVQEQIKEATTKVGQPKLAIARIEKFLIPLPPLAEQNRIVAKINEIFAML